METNDKESDELIDENHEQSYDYEEDVESINLNFPAISPISNISSSSGNNFQAQPILIL